MINGVMGIAERAYSLVYTVGMFTGKLVYVMLGFAILLVSFFCAIVLFVKAFDFLKICFWRRRKQRKEDRESGLVDFRESELADLREKILVLTEQIEDESLALAHARPGDFAAEEKSIAYLEQELELCEKKERELAQVVKIEHPWMKK